MNRYKGRPSAKVIEKDFPHIVEMRVPLGGFGETLDAEQLFVGAAGYWGRVARSLPYILQWASQKEHDTN
jgi:hypothetical protein